MAIKGHLIQCTTPFLVLFNLLHQEEVAAVKYMQRQLRRTLQDGEEVQRA